MFVAMDRHVCGCIFKKHIYIYMYGLVISCYKDDIIITQDRSRAEVECSNKDIIRMKGYNWFLSHKVKIGNLHNNFLPG